MTHKQTLSLPHSHFHKKKHLGLGAKPSIWFRVLMKTFHKTGTKKQPNESLKRENKIIQWTKMNKTGYFSLTCISSSEVFLVYEFKFSSEIFLVYLGPKYIWCQNLAISLILF